MDIMSPVRVHSPVRYIPAPCIGWARVSILPGRVVPVPQTKPPVCLSSPVSPVPASRTRPPVCLPSLVSPVPPVMIHGTKPPVKIYETKPTVKRN